MIVKITFLIVTSLIMYAPHIKNQLYNKYNSIFFYNKGFILHNSSGIVVDVIIITKKGVFYILKKYLVSIIVSVMMFAFIVSPIANAQVSPNISEEQQIDEVADQLKFIWEEASIRDESGNIIGIDIEKIENKYGPSTSQDQEALEAIVNFNLANGSALDTDLIYDNDQSGLITPFNAAVDACMGKKVKDYFGVFILPSTLTLIFQWINEGNYISAAKKLLELGVKGNIYVIAGTMGAFLIECNYEQGGWY